MSLSVRFANFVSAESSPSLFPVHEPHIKETAESLDASQHVAFVFEMNLLVVSLPPEVPTPYLDGENRIFLWERSEVAQVLAARAEWLLLDRTHIAAEFSRVIYDSAKGIAWCACSGVRIITIYELSGHPWADMLKIRDMVETELRSLSEEKDPLFDFIKLVQLDSLEAINVYETSTNSYITDGNSYVGAGVDRTNSSVSTEENDKSATESTPSNRKCEAQHVDSRSVFCSNLTVFSCQETELV